jgi:iduronate 2-sulfatase
MNNLSHFLRSLRGPPRPRRFFLCLACVFAAAMAVVNAADKKLNVLFIVSDDLNCSLGCYGDKVTQTPNINRLAARGVRFDRAYCNYPVCNASRTSFLSGRRPETTKVLGNGVNPRVALGADVKFLPEYFHDHGYFTASIGKISHPTFASTVKWDVQEDAARGQGESDEEAPAAKQKAKAGKGKLDDAAKAKRAERREAKAAAKAAPGGEVPFGWQATTNDDADEPDGITARRVVKLIEQHTDGPFFIAAGFHKPHVPHTAPKKYFAMYDAAKMPLPQEPAGHAKYIPEIANPPKYYPELSPDQERAIIQHYHAATTFMDAQVGLLLDTLDRLKLWDNTIVVFLGDHGWHLGEHDGFWAKMSIMEESARAPLIIYAPKASGGREAPGTSPSSSAQHDREASASRSPIVCNRLAEFVDIFPTLTDLCGLPLPGGLEGISLAPLLDDPNRPWKKAAFTVVSRPRGLGRAVRTETHTLLVWPDGNEQLYDHTRDPHEYENLATDTRVKETADQLRRLLSAGWKSALP